MLRHLVFESSLREMLRGCSRRSATAGVQSNEFLFLRQPGHHEDVTADASTFGLDDVQDSGGGYRGVKSIAALFEDLQAGLRGQRLAGGYYAVAGEDF